MIFLILEVKYARSSVPLTIFRKMISHVSKAMSRGSHSTSTDVSLMDLNFRPSGAGRSVRKSRGKDGWMLAVVVVVVGLAVDKAVISLNPTGGCPTPVRAGFYSWLLVGCCLLWGSVTISIRTHHRIKSWQFHMVKPYEPRVWNARNLGSNLGSALQVVREGANCRKCSKPHLLHLGGRGKWACSWEHFEDWVIVACRPLGMVPGAQHISICGSQCYS